jgi:hypothetical protein
MATTAASAGKVFVKITGRKKRRKTLTFFAPQDALA